ncbi:class I SAM-dependent methyltransferase [Vibrio campbellii]
MTQQSHNPPEFMDVDSEAALKVLLFS